MSEKTAGKLTYEEDVRRGQKDRVRPSSVVDRAAAGLLTSTEIEALLSTAHALHLLRSRGHIPAGYARSITDASLDMVRNAGIDLDGE